MKCCNASISTLKNSNKNDLWCRQEVELRMKTPDDFLGTSKDDVLPMTGLSYGAKPHPDGTATLPTRHRMNTKQWCQEQRAQEQGNQNLSHQNSIGPQRLMNQKK